jgi:RNA methyltransferase, TrmH family
MSSIISSRANESIRAIRRLRERKERERTGRFFAEGIRIVTEALHAGAPIETVVYAPELLRSEVGRGVVRECEMAGAAVLAVTPEVFASLSVKEGPQGLGAVVRARWEGLEDTMPVPGSCWVALESVADPGNLGTIVRTSDAAGCAGVILLGASTDPYDPTALRASMGSVFALQLVRASFAQLVTWAQRHGLQLVGTSGAATTEYRSLTYRVPTVLVMGSERTGLSAEQQRACDAVVRIPMVGSADSLNLAVATGIVLYEILDQRLQAAAER